MLEEKDNVGAVSLALSLLHREGTSSRGLPAHGLVRAGHFRDHGHAVGNHERRIETNAELPDELGVACGLALYQCRKELPCA